MSSLLLSLAAAAGLSSNAPAPPRIRIVPQHSGRLIRDIEESKDGTRLITHDKSFAPRLWDAKRQILLCVLDGHPDVVDRVTFSKDGSRIIARSPKMVSVWDSLRARRTFTYSAPEGEAITSAVLAPDGATLAFGLAKGEVSLVSIDAKATPHRLGSHTKAVMTVTFSPDGTRLVSGSEDATARVWDAKAQKPLAALTGHQGAIRWVDFAPQGNLLLTTSLDNTAGLWNPEGKRLAIYPHVIGERSVGNDNMAALFVGKGLGEVAACEKDGTIRLYKPGETKSIRALTGHADSIREIRRSHDGMYVATYANDETLRMWDVAAAKEMEFEPEEGLPTAGEFSPNRDVFWLGYSAGEVRQFDLKTGKATKETLGAVDPLSGAEMIGEENIVYWRGEMKEGGGIAGGPSQHVFMDPSGANRALSFEASLDKPGTSPDGRYFAANSRSGRKGFMLIDLWEDRVVATSEKMLDAGWSSDSKRLAVLDTDAGGIQILDPKTGATLHHWTWPTDKEWGGLGGPAWHPNGKWLLTTHHPGKVVKLWDSETGKEVKSFGKFEDLYGEAQFIGGGKTLLLRGWTSLYAYDVESGKELWHKESGDYTDMRRFQVSKNGQRIVFSVDDKVVVLDTATNKEVFSDKIGGAFGLSDDGRRILIGRGNTVTLVDLETKKELNRLTHVGRVKSCQFVGTDRYVTSDDTAGLQVWNLAGDRLATMVAMKDGSWLVYDDQGRYDASDPSGVNGAYFVLEWEGGLEPIAMAQLKGQFYEPHLLAKALGTEKEPRRDVPTLESLRLFPSLSVTKENGLTYAIESKERDNGGIGQVRISINGKEVSRKRGAGFFKLDLNDYAQYLLPEARLPEGQRNLLSVTVSNEAGDLTSPPETMPVGLPEGLKTPDVKLYALCVGIGDYVGTAGDLQAPASDASAIGKTLQEVANRLLPNRTEVEVMTTDPDAKRPTRENILGWLKATGAKATSSDIVFVFVAGHGMSRIGDQSGYFMLTSEADPGDMTPASAKTGAISGEELRQALAAIPAGKQVVILDTCHSGAAAPALLATSRSISSEYQRAWEAIKDTTGTWLLAGAAADQVSYESPNVDHGMLTYALLEAVDKASADGLRRAPSGELFVDVERWLEYAANRVESLKNEVGIKGVQRPEFKRAARGATFDIGVMDEKRKGFLALRAPMPIVILGNFQSDQEDPLNLEEAVASAMKESKTVKPWFGIAKHPGVYRMAGEYTVSGETVTLRLILQIFDDAQQRKNLETVEVTGAQNKPAELAQKVRAEIEARVKARETPKA
jgi:WD40 repeat protein